MGKLWCDWDVNSGLGRITTFAVRLRWWSHRNWRRKALACLPLAAAWWWLASVIGAEIPPSVRIGPGLRLPHGGRGVVIHPAAVIGAGVTVYHRVTIGVRGSQDKAPHIGDGVYIGTGACLLGEISVGDGARVGANAVAIYDIAPNSTYVGFPAGAPERG